MPMGDSFEKKVGNWKDKLKKTATLGAIAASAGLGEGCSPDKTTESGDAGFLGAAREVVQNIKKDEEKSHNHLLKSYYQFVKEGQSPPAGVGGIAPETLARARELAFQQRMPAGDKTLEVKMVAGYVPLEIWVGGAPVPLGTSSFTAAELVVAKSFLDTIADKREQARTASPDTSGPQPFVNKVNDF